MKRVLSLALLLGCQQQEPTAPTAVAIPSAERTTTGLQSPPPDPPRPEYDGPHGTQPFDEDAAKDALRSADLSRCFIPGGPSGNGRAMVTFEPSGHVASVTVDAGAVAGTPIGDCVAKVFSTVTVTPFAGAPKRVSKSFVVN